MAIGGTVCDDGALLWGTVRGGKGGGCRLLQASRWVDAAPCCCDVIFAGRAVSGYASYWTVDNHYSQSVYRCV
jgi:hypothetical protein